MRILAVDDDEQILEILVTILDAFGYPSVVSTMSARSAAKIISTATEPFDLILLDLMMPEIDGIQLCRDIRKIPGYRTTPIIMITAMSDKAHIDRAFISGATDYVTKPFDVMELRNRVQAAEKQVAANRLIRETGEEMRAVRARLGDQRRFALSDAIILNDVEGLVDRLALENYFQLRSRAALFSTRAIAFRIHEVADIFARCSGALFHDVLADVAESALAALSDWQGMLAYVGNGTFAGVLSEAADLDHEEVELLINTILFRLELADDRGRPLQVQVVVGAAQKRSVPTSRRAAVTLLQRCIEEIGWTSRRPISTKGSKRGGLTTW